MKNLTLKHDPEPGRHAGDEISRLLNTHGQPVLLLVSGGSALSVLEHIDEDALGTHVTISMVDDRFSPESGINNFLDLKDSLFYKKACVRGVSFISSLPSPTEDMETTAHRWEAALRAWKRKHAGITIALLGIGEDGHTAGIMPFPEDREKFRSLFMNDRWIVAYDAGRKNTHPLRVTSSITFLTGSVDHALFFLKGESKSSILKAVMGSTDVAAYPASVMHSMKRVSIYTDIHTDGGNG